MLKSLFKRSNQLVHMVFTESAIRMIEFKSISPLEAKHTFHTPLPEGVIEKGKIVDLPLLESIVEQCVADWKIKHKKVQFIVPDPFVIIRQIELKENLSQQEIQGYLYMELGNRIQLPFEEPVFDFVKLPTESGKDLLIFASPEDVVKSYRDLLEKAGLEPVTADISPLALYRYYERYSEIEEEDHLLILRFDQRQLTISIFHQGYPYFMRPIAFEEDRGEEAYGELYSEISKILSFYRYSIHQGSGEISRVYVSGDWPDLDAFAEGLKQELTLEFQYPFQPEYSEDDLEMLPDQFEIATGLGLKEVEA
ncbi:pilus assembly protein PilM [Jeotgalibacillus sp. ET6]|uniref:type IV pilus biogenesis protein PilM n=1 Tax=Jeotgalibacillus sp. ET6 TaxID=3037260 RepID=UPI0024185958|nr:pilus assembly protein PilM [Jeotgalibacillus sp. ET6]MDG5470957.1 pilus assembly protein PilM [Jeotgalibacillus sp. ET6]